MGLACSKCCCAEEEMKLENQTDKSKKTKKYNGSHKLNEAEANKILKQVQSD